jgi:hypothetical protein
LPIATAVPLGRTGFVVDAAAWRITRDGHAAEHTAGFGRVKATLGGSKAAACVVRRAEAKSEESVKRRRRGAQADSPLPTGPSPVSTDSSMDDVALPLSGLLLDVTTEPQDDFEMPCDVDMYAHGFLDPAMDMDEHEAREQPALTPESTIVAPQWSGVDTQAVEAAYPGFMRAFNAEWCALMEAATSREVVLQWRRVVFAVLHTVFDRMHANPVSLNTHGTDNAAGSGGCDVVSYMERCVWRHGVSSSVTRDLLYWSVRRCAQDAGLSLTQTVFLDAKCPVLIAH